LNFHDSSTAGSAVVATQSGGTTQFFDASTGGTARFITNSGGTFDISTLTAAGMTAGSIEGAGNYFLGSKALTVGLNNLSTVVSGVIADGGSGGGIGGSINKVGTGTLTLNNVDTYTGGTTVGAGAIVAGDSTHPGAALSGGGPIFVAAGATFGGFGSAQGSVTNQGTIVAGNATPGFGAAPVGTFTIIGNVLNQGTLNLASDPTVGNVLAINGNYVGAGGAMNVNTVLASDNSPSDKLVISLGNASGNTSVHVTNAGGQGAETVSNGILVVQAINGGTTVPGAFQLGNPNGVALAGPFEYRLFRHEPLKSLPSPADDSC
jgi:autotransporter-associated beta strand protein